MPAIKVTADQTCDFACESGECVCRKCGRVAPVHPTTAMCRRPVAAPSLLQKASNFAKSAARHIAAGAPVASEEQIALRYYICVQCEFFDGAACLRCGCPVIRERQYLSKLSWANESCPVGKWGPVDRAANQP